MRLTTKALTVLAAAATVAGCGVGAATPPAQSGSPLRFSAPRTIDNPYLPLTRFTRCEFRGEKDDGTRQRSVKTLLRRTRAFQVDGRRVDAAVIQDRAFENGKLVERTLDYYAQADDGTVYYLGEHVDNIEDGRVVDHHGTWLYGPHTDTPGVAMPAHPRLGDQWRFEDVPGITMESNRLEETALRADAGGRRHLGVIRVSEFLQPDGDVEQKLYAPGTGLITEYPPDGRVELVGCS
jgi:hypothetical protein